MASAYAVPFQPSANNSRRRCSMLVLRPWRTAVCVLATWCCCSPVFAGGGPHDVALIVNPNDEDSLTVANYYVAFRGIPSRNVIHIPWKLDAQRMSGKAFVQNLILPIIKQLDDRELREQVDYIVYSCGFPYYVDFSKGFDGASDPPNNKPAMSLNSATFLYAAVVNKQLEAFGMTSNYYYSPTPQAASGSRSFSAAQSWGSRGQRLARGGRRYYLSTMLGSTYGRGNDVGEIVAALKRAREADGTRPSGTIYYMRNNNVRSRVRHDSFAAAIEALEQLAVKARLLNGRQPNNRLDIAGLTTGATHVKVLSQGGRLVPGALVDNLTSAGGQLQVNPRNKNPQTAVSQYVREGAAGASGTVIEPYAVSQKFPDAFLHVHYARGCSLAESFYQSVRGPYQLLIVGDPLCRPWAKIPQVDVPGVNDGATISGTFDLTPTAQIEGDAGVKQFEAFVGGELVANCEPDGTLTIDTTKLADGWQRLNVLAVDDTPIAVQGGWSNIVEIKNGAGVVQLTAPSGDRVNMGDALSVRVRASRPGPTHVYHLGKEIGVVEGNEGQLRIDTRDLGRGPVLLEARQTGQPTIHARPLVVQID